MTQTEKKPKQKKLEFGMTRHYGSVSIHFQVSDIVEVTSITEQQAEMEKLIAQVWFHHDEYAKTHLHKTPPPPSRSDSDYKKPDTFLERIPCDVATLTIDDGKRYIKIKGGKYVKHGVVIWDEVLKTTDILERMGTSTQVDMKGYTMVVDTSGRPKVVEVIPPNGTR